MKLVPLNKGYSAKVDDADYEWLMQWKWYAAVRKHTIYALGPIKDSGSGRYKTVLMHRLILGLFEGDNLTVDHINGNGLDNQRRNIRIATHAQNQANKQTHKNKYLGVDRVIRNGKDVYYRASVGYDKNKRKVSYHYTEEDAALAYNVMAKYYHGEFAALNKIDFSNLPKTNRRILWEIL